MPSLKISLISNGKVKHHVFLLPPAQASTAEPEPNSFSRLKVWRDTAPCTQPWPFLQVRLIYPAERSEVLWADLRYKKLQNTGAHTRQQISHWLTTWRLKIWEPYLWATTRLGASGNVYHNQLMWHVLLSYVWQKQKKHTLSRNLFDVYLLYPLIHTTQKSNLQPDHWAGPGEKTKNIRSLSIPSLHHRKSHIWLEFYFWPLVILENGAKRTKGKDSEIAMTLKVSL